MKTQTIISLLIILTLLSCNQDSKIDTTKKNTIENKNKTAYKKIKNNCDLSAMIITESNSKSNKTKMLDKPVAITFFNLNKLLQKYEAINLDSLPKKLRNPNRQEIYKTRDILGVYDAIIKPKLDSMSIKIIDTIQTAGSLSFKVRNQSYTINKKQFNETDGVLFYNGTDNPIFWPNKDNCTLEQIIECYYKNKNCP